MTLASDPSIGWIVENQQRPFFVCICDGCLAFRELKGETLIEFKFVTQTTWSLLGY